MRYATIVLLAILLLPNAASSQSNPVPFVSQALSPESTKPGGPDFTLTVNGANFIPESVVLWNGIALPTTFIAAYRLTATVAAGSIANSGTAWISVANPSPGGGSSNLEYLSIATPYSSFTPNLSKTDFPIAFSPGAIAAGDFNGDGILDLVSAGYSNVAVLLGKGNGTFQSSWTYTQSGMSPFWIVIGDFNGDGKLDFALTDAAAIAIDTFLGNGDGTFQTPLVSSVPATGATGLVTGDFNQDGKLDLAVTNDSQNTGIAIMEGNGDGTFSGGGGPYDYGSYPLGVTTGDLTGDGILDLAVSNWGYNTVDVFFGMGNGTFGAYSLLPGNIVYPFAVAMADVDNDGNLDVAVANRDINWGATVAFGNGAGGFPRTTYTSPIGEPDGMALGDFNADGNLDLAVYSYTNTMAILIANGAGVYNQYPSFVPLENGALEYVVADFNGDGRPDLATPGANAVSVFLQAPTATTTPTSLQFGIQLVNSRTTQTVNLSNSGTADLLISSIVLNGAKGFTQTNNCGSDLAPLSECSISVTFKPQVDQHLTASLTINDNAVGSPQIVRLYGTGTVVELVPSSLNFGAVTVGTTSPPQTVTLSNTGGAGALKISSTGIDGTDPGDFAATDNCGTSVLPGGSCTFSVTFTPWKMHVRTADLYVTYVTDNGGGTQTVSLGGRGIQ